MLKSACDRYSLDNLQMFYVIVLRAEIIAVFEWKMVTISARNTAQVLQTFQDYILHTLQQFASKLCNFTSLRKRYGLFHHQKR